MFPKPTVPELEGLRGCDGFAYFTVTKGSPGEIVYYEFSVNNDPYSTTSDVTLMLTESNNTYNY